MPRKILKDTDDLDRLGVIQLMMLDIAQIRAPILMTPGGLKGPLAFGTSRARRLVQSIELTISGHDAATGSRTHVDPHPQERCMDTVLARASGSLAVF
jgi:hypothetical protein